MKNIFKFTGVSMLAVVATSNANAAGYTCEELIEYTSCNAGYYLDDSIPECPSGYTFKTGICDNFDEMGEWYVGVTREECMSSGGYYPATYYEYGCVQGDMGDYQFQQTADTITKTCSECPTGSYCPAGSESPTPCPAGSYCATAGLSTPTNVCAKGSFSFAGATECLSCPSAAMKDKDGNVVATTTESTGATSFTACYIDRNAYFADDKGIYHFSQNCTFNANDDYGLDFYESADGTCVNGYVYGEDTDAMHVGCFRLPSTEEECSVADYGNGVYWDGKQCVCPGGFSIEYINDLRC